MGPILGSIFLIVLFQLSGYAQVVALGSLALVVLFLLGDGKWTLRSR